MLYKPTGKYFIIYVTRFYLKFVCKNKKNSDCTFFHHEEWCVFPKQISPNTEASPCVVSKFKINQKCHCVCHECIKISSVQKNMHQTRKYIERLE